MSRRHNNRKGPGTTDRFVALPHYMLRSAAWQALTPVARAVLIEVLVLYRGPGTSNGYLALSARSAGKRCRCSKDTAHRAFTELQRLGFLELAKEGSFDRKSPHANEWRATLYPCDRTHAVSSKAFMRWRPPPETKTRSDHEDSWSLP